MKLSVNSKKYRRRIALCASVGRFCCTPLKRKSQKVCYYRYVNGIIFLKIVFIPVVVCTFAISSLIAPPMLKHEKKATRSTLQLLIFSYEFGSSGC